MMNPISALSPTPSATCCQNRSRRPPPETLWVYNGGGTDLLGNILERVSAKPLEAFAREALLQPLDVSDFEWKSDPKNGKIAAAPGLRLRPRDAAKLG